MEEVKSDSDDDEEEELYPVDNDRYDFPDRANFADSI
jgi:hypothetical protein